MNRKPVPPPAGLESRGRKFWTTLTGEYELAPAELELLVEVCRTLDQVERLAEKGPPGELRLQRVVLARLIGQLGVPADEKPLTGPQSRGRAAARARWGK